ncbi:MAG: hypothetical protein WBC73_09780 [Phormidesmis sp.]
MRFFKSLIVDKFLSVWWAVVILLLALPFAVWLLSFRISSAQAYACRLFNGHEVCAVSIRRSAARYWEYRTVVEIDGIKQPMERYNCRDRTRTLAKDGTIIPFLTDKTGDWICSLTKPTRASTLDERVTIDIR